MLKILVKKSCLLFFSWKVVASQPIHIGTYNVGVSSKL